MLDTTSALDIDIGPRIVIAGWCEASIATIVVALRIYTQTTIIGQVYLEDYLMIGALCLAVLNTSLITHAVSWGIGRHVYDLETQQVIIATKYEFFAQAPGIIAPALARISLAIYLAKFVGTSKMRKRLLWSVVIIQALCNAVQIILILFQCDKIETLWNPSIGGKCWSRNVQVYSGYAIGAANCAHDLILTFVPMSILKDLNMSVRIKTVLSVLMGMSVFAFAASIVKTIKLGNLAKVSDFTYLTVDFIMWFTIENYIVIVAASIPNLRPLITRMRKRSLGKEQHIYTMTSFRKRSNRRTKGCASYSGKKYGLSNQDTSNIIRGHDELGRNSTGSESEEHILPISLWEGKGIIKTTDVSISYSEERANDLESGLTDIGFQRVTIV